MALVIKVQINDYLISIAAAVNKSALAEVSNYEVEAISYGSKFNGGEDVRHKFWITGHNQEQTGWALVAKVAAEIAKREGA